MSLSVVQHRDALLILTLELEPLAQEWAQSGQPGPVLQNMLHGVRLQGRRGNRAGDTDPPE